MAKAFAHDVGERGRALQHFLDHGARQWVVAAVRGVDGCEPSPRPHARREQTEGRRHVKHRHVDDDVLQRRVDAPILEPRRVDAVEVVLDHGGDDVVHHRRPGLAAAARAEAHLAVADAVGLRLEADAELVIVDCKVGEHRRLAGRQALALQAKLVDGARRVVRRRVGLVVVGVEVARVDLGVVAPHDAAHLAHQRRVPVLLVEAELGALEPRILDRGHVLAVLRRAFCLVAAHALEHAVDDALGLPPVDVAVLGVRGGEEREGRRLRGALEAFGGPRAAELRVVRAAHQAAVGRDALERRAVKDAAEQVGGDQPDGAPLRDFAREAGVALLHLGRRRVVEPAKVGQVGPARRGGVVGLAGCLVGDALGDVDHLVPKAGDAGKRLKPIDDGKRKPGGRRRRPVGVAIVLDAVELLLPGVGLEQVHDTHERVDEAEHDGQQKLHEEDHEELDAPAQDLHEGAVGKDAHEGSAQRPEEQHEGLEDEAEDDRENLVDHVPEQVGAERGDRERGAYEGLHAVEEGLEPNLRQERVRARFGQAARRLGAHDQRRVPGDRVGVARRADGLGKQVCVSAKLRGRLILRREFRALGHTHVALKRQRVLAQHAVVRLAGKRQDHDFDHDKDCRLRHVHGVSVEEWEEDDCDFAQ